MAVGLARNWWLLLLRGVAGVLFGVLTFIYPGLTLAVLVLMFGAYALVDGVFGMIVATRRVSQGGGGRWGALLWSGVAGIAAGGLTFLMPEVAATFLLYLIAAWAILIGVAQIAAAIRLRKQISGELLLGLSGVLSVLFGVLLIARPGAGALAVVWLIGAYAIVSGALLVALAFRLRSWSARNQATAPVV